MNKIKKMLAERISSNRQKLWDWHLSHAKAAPPPFYCSIDLRDSGHKIVPVDSNLYPAGFNNICPEDLRSAPHVLRAQVEAQASRLGHSTPRQLLILPESHTTNAFYIENLHYLRQILRDAGFEAEVGWYGPIPEGQVGPIHLKSATGKELDAIPMTIEAGVVSAGGFVPDLILLNNDFSGGYPEALDAVTQPIVPSHVLGWHSRKKSEHFRYYNELAAEFAAIVDVDPWTIQIDTREVGPVNFNEDQGIDDVARTVDEVIAGIREQYDRHGVKHKPIAFVKNNSGTYGMGIMTAHSGDEIRQMNRRTKNKMSVGKNRSAIESVVVQEGIPTATIVDRLAAEPVVYLFGCELIGGFLRTNTEKGVEENLNSQGMVFRKLCMSDLRKPGDEDGDRDRDDPMLELVYGSIARISALATGKELARHVAERSP
jgi:glutamate--cysteine ligase